MKAIHLFLMLLLPFSVFSQSSYEIPVADLQELIVDVYDASIHVVGTESAMASVRILQAGSGKAASNKDYPHYDIQVDRGTLKVFKKRGPRVKNIRIEVNIPMDFACSLDTYFGKQVEVQNISGDLIIDNHFGKVTVVDCHGRIEVNSFEGLVKLEGLKESAIVHNTEGNIEASFSSIPSNFTSMFSSNKGDINISMPRRASLIVGMDTFNGKIESQFQLGIVPGNLLERQGLGSNFSYRSINRGKPNSFLKIKNYFGDIGLLINEN